MFFQRIEFELDGFAIPRDEIRPALQPLVDRFGLDCDLRFSDSQPRVAILVSKQAHCLHDLLGRWHMGEMPGELTMVISNHPDNGDIVERFGVPFHHLR